MKSFAALRRLASLLLLSLFTLLSIQMTHASDASSDWDRNDHIGVRLISAVQGTGDLDTIPLALEFEIKKGWKIYWRSPGDAGYPPQPNWAGSSNLSSYTIDWPRPTRFEVLGMQSLGYKDHVILPLNVKPVLPSAPLHIKGEVNYLTCEEICIPYTAMLDFELPAGTAQPSEHAQAINEYSSKVPLQVALSESNLTGLHLTNTGIENQGELTKIRLQLASTTPISNLDVIVEGPEGSYFDPPVTAAGPDGNSTIIDIIGGGLNSAEDLTKVFTFTVWSEEKAIETTTGLTQGINHISAPSSGAAPILEILLLALIGGFILNLMPCVLPVLSLKVLSVIEHSNASSARIRLNFLATVFGILSAFLLLALSLILIKQAGYTIGWGIQFQQPLFLIFMIFVVMAFAANMLGFFEIMLPSSVATTAATAGQEGSGLKSHFLTGVFATLLATPCSAPFLGTAVGFALSQGALEIIAVFLALGVGLASPYILFMIAPALARKLPKPGKWMNWVKRILSLALIATGLWLTSVLYISVGLELSLVILLLSVLMIGIFYLRKKATYEQRHKFAAIALAPFVIAFILPLAFKPAPTAQASLVDDIQWQVFNEAEIPAIIAEDKIVFVDVTADWCITCQFNKRTVLTDSDIQAWFNKENVVALKADWTMPDEKIASFLQSHGRYGIPFNIIYSKSHPNGIVLPELLTVGEVLESFEDANS